MAAFMAIHVAECADVSAVPAEEVKGGVEAKGESAPAEARVDPRTHQTPALDLGISPNEPVYFSLGFHEFVHAKFQISLKYRPFGPTDDTIAGEDFWNDLYAAYTQTSLWDLQSDSKPFYDTSYRPSIFYHRQDFGEFLGGRFGVRGGFEHESNGKSDADSRSINILFIRPSWWWNVNDKWALAFTPKVYTYIEDSENPDIADYRGYVDWNIALAQDKGVRLSAMFRHGTEGHFSALVDLSYPLAEITVLRAIGLKHGYMHLQYFDGYGETILNYNERLPWQVRVGIMIVR